MTSNTLTSDVLCLLVYVRSAIDYKKEKCQWFSLNIAYLGHVVSANGTRLDPI